MTMKWELVARVYDPLKAGSIDGTDTVPHDHGVVRAMQADYKPNKMITGNPKNTLFVGRLDSHTDEPTIKDVFSCFGKIKKLSLVRDIVTGFSRGYAFIEYYDVCDATEAQRELNRTILDGKEILVDFECERLLPGWVPRRLGGGLGGKKESGQLRFGGRDRPFKKPIIAFGERDRKSDYERSDYDRRNDYERSDYDRRNDYERRGHYDRRSDYDRRDAYDSKRSSHREHHHSQKKHKYKSDSYDDRD